MELKRLSSDDFERLANETNLGDHARLMARAVLVDGRGQAEVATENEMSRQRINLAVGAIKRAYKAAGGSGQGIVSVLLEVPECLALELATFNKALSSCSSDELRKAVLDKAISGLVNARKLAKK